MEGNDCSNHLVLLRTILPEVDQGRRRECCVVRVLGRSKAKVKDFVKSMAPHLYEELPDGSPMIKYLVVNRKRISKESADKALSWYMERWLATSVATP